jgi:ADP-heptose:LPS heptosyltransferase
VIVAYRALGLGDFLTGVPALRALARAFPHEELVLAAPAAIAPLAALTGAVTRVADAAPLAPLPRALYGADVAVNLHGRGPQSHALLRAAAPRRLIAFGPDVAEGPEPATGRAGATVRWRPREHEVRRWCRLLSESGILADPHDLALAPPPVAPPPAAVGATVLHPGAASPARRWPAERWAEVARAERDAGRPVAVTGGPGEERLAAAVAARAGLPAGAVLAGRTGLLELAAAVAAAGRIVCGDTGVAHLATAFGTPSVVLFGPTPPAEWGPPALARHRVLWAGRRGDPHAGAPDPGLLAIGVDAVLDALAVLDRASVRHPGARQTSGGVDACHGVMDLHPVGQVPHAGCDR